MTLNYSYGTNDVNISVKYIHIYDSGQDILNFEFYIFGHL
jgi:hypothetical protein